MAIFLGGMVLLGLQPGITMIETRLDLTYTIIWSLAIANILGAGLCVLVSRHVARLTTIPYVYLAPFMIMIVLFAAYQATRDWGDILALMGLGVLGIYMRRFGWPRPPLLIGFVLAPGAETYLYQAIQFHDWAWLWRPGVIIIAAATILSVWAGMRLGKSGIDEGGQSAVGVERRWPQIVFAALLTAAFAYALERSLGWSYLSQVFPLGVALPATGGMLAVLAILVTGRDHVVVFDTERIIAGGGRSMEYYLAWLVALLVASALVGFVLGLALFFVAFLAVEAHAGARRVAVLTCRRSASWRSCPGCSCWISRVACSRK